MQNDRCMDVINGKICRVSGYREAERIIRESGAIAKNIHGKNADKIIVTGKDGTWKMAFLTYPDDPGKMVLFKPVD